MQAQWCLVDRSRSKRSNDEESDISSKRQRRERSRLESSDECEDLPQIRGGLARPRPPQVGPPPNRATNTASRANKTTPPANTAAPRKTPQSKVSIVDSDDDDDDKDWRPRKKVPTQPSQSGTTGAVVETTDASNASGQPPGLPGIQGTSNPPNQPPQVGNTTIPLPPVEVPPQQPTPPQTGPSNRKQGVNTDAGTGTSGPGGTTSTTTPTPTPTPTKVVLPPFPQESEILQLYSRLQEMVVTWVEECLPDVFPEEFQTERPERYWELCGWCRPRNLGNTMLSHRSWAKYVYESWVWRFLYQEIFRPGSIAWAGNDLPRNAGGAGGIGRAVNAKFENLYDPSQRTMTPDMYLKSIQTRAAMMQKIRSGFISERRHLAVTGEIVTEMLVAFHPYFSDAYKPADQPQNIEVLIRDTMFLVAKARELDQRLRSARHLYDLILGREGDECRISGVRSPAIQRYEVAGNNSTYPHYFNDDSLLALIVVPGLIRFDLEEDLYGTDDKLTKADDDRRRNTSSEDEGDEADDDNQGQLATMGPPIDAHVASLVGHASQMIGMSGADGTALALAAANVATPAEALNLLAASSAVANMGLQRASSNAARARFNRYNEELQKLQNRVTLLEWLLSRVLSMMQNGNIDAAEVAQVLRNLGI
ncbi:hypothetical protein INS49_000312 [Diaporthe citri]|uniref:uncharacterized protein n=1 Tax=Diaporthe citri TaxID=83186 RepID=UPI001C823BC3|nr:uncharacterized protein INS49_000312 [Diaporthe citri]KAG6366136.1 hypothetical protein INS49_000312 [Diaporthe citri]